MGIKYTKKNEDQEQQERTIQADDFMRLMISTHRKDKVKTELPKTEKQKYLRNLLFLRNIRKHD